MESHIYDVNCNHLSENMSIGMPKYATQCVINAWVQAKADALERGIASGHLVKWLTIVRRGMQQADGGRGPTKSISM